MPILARARRALRSFHRRALPTRPARTPRVALAALATLLALPAAPTAARAQLGVAVACTPGIPGCSQLRFTLSSTPDLALDALTLQLVTPGWTFTPIVAGGTVGSYAAEDALGPFGGTTTIGAVGRTAAIDFLETAAPFTIAPGSSGFLDLEVAGTGNAAGLSVDFIATTADGTRIVGNTIPEPGTVVLLSTGMLALALVGRRRARRTSHDAA